MSLSLETSKLIFDLVGEYPTRLHWKSYIDRDTGERYMDRHPSEVDYFASAFAIPAPDFGETVRIMVKIGEKKGWNNRETAYLSHINGKMIYHVSDVIYTLSEKYCYAPSPELGMEEVDTYIRKVLV